MGQVAVSRRQNMDRASGGAGLPYYSPARGHLSGLIGKEPKGRLGNLLPLLAQAGEFDICGL